MMPVTAREPDTKTRLLEVGERLFALHGFEGTSLRSIIKEAGVNVAAIHYHFGSKEALLLAILEHRIGPVNAERLRRLDALEAAGAQGGGVARPLELEAVLEAFFRPTADLVALGSETLRFCGRCQAGLSDDLKERVLAIFHEVRLRYAAAFQRALPGLPPDVMAWRVHFFIGAMVHTLTASYMLERMSGGRCRADDPERITKEWVDFVAAGLRAPSSKTRGLATGGGRR